MFSMNGSLKKDRAKNIAPVVKKAYEKRLEIEDSFAAENLLENAPESI